MQNRISNTGLSVAYEPENCAPVADIVFIHGFDGHPYKSWASARAPHTATSPATAQPKASGDGSGKSSPVFWPVDLLPKECPDSRILMYGYETAIANVMAGATNDIVFSYSKDLLSVLGRERILNRPLIFVAHGLGGLIVKAMLASSATSTAIEHNNVIDSTAAVIFLGTPHRGSPNRTAPSELVQSTVGTYLEQAQEAFSRLWQKHDFRVKTFQGMSNKAAPASSSMIGDRRERAETINANHMEMCRFTGVDDPNYHRVAGELRSIYLSIARSVDLSGHIQRSGSMLSDASLVQRHGANEDELSEAEKACLQSLWFPNMNAHSQNLKNPAEQTCLWLFKHKAYEDWFNGRNRDKNFGLLWLKGKPGVGKSTLMKEAFRRSVLGQAKSDYCTAAFFFDAGGVELEHSPVGLFRSLLYQLLPGQREHLQNLAKLLDKTKLDRGDDAAESLLSDEAELKFLFESVFAQASAKRTLIFIDALDECDLESIRSQAYFWKKMTESAYTQGVDLNVCLSSRHYPSISIRGCPEIVIEHHNSHDIAAYVEQRLKPLDIAIEKKLLQDTVLRKSAGVFLWVVLIVDIMLMDWDQGKNLQYLLKQLDVVPEELETLFSDIFRSLSAEERQLTVRFFQWAILAVRPLRLHEWHHILAFIRQPTPSSLREWRGSDYFTDNDSQLERQIRAVSRGLVEVRPRVGEPKDRGFETISVCASAGSLDDEYGDTRVVQVIHESVRDFFLKSNGFSILDPSVGSHPIGDGHRSIMATCLDYINIAELDTLIQARTQAGRGEKAQPNSDPYRTARTHRPPRYDATWEDGESSPRPPKRLGGEMAEGSLLRTPIKSSDSAAQIDIPQWVATIQSDADQLPLNESTRNSTTDLSISGQSQILEDYPALLSYVISNLLPHVQLAAGYGVYVEGTFSDDEKTWTRWAVLNEDMSQGIQFSHSAANPSLSLLASNIFSSSEAASWDPATSRRPSPTEAVREGATEGLDPLSEYSRPDKSYREENIEKYPPEQSYSEPSLVLAAINNLMSHMAPEAPTDSGSASATHGKSLQAYSSTGNELEVISEVTRYTHEDSVSVRPQSPVDKQNVQNLGLYTADTTYSASETSTLPPPRNTGYITDLATELFHAVKPYESHRKTFERISDMLPDLLRSFALKLGHKAQSQLHRDVSFFVHKYRSRIRVSFEDMLPLEDVVPNVPPSNTDRTQLRNFALGRYLGDLDFDMGQQTIALIEDNGYHDDELIPPTPKSYEDLLSDLTSPESDENDDAQEDDMKPTPPDAGMYRDFIVKTPAYSWLVASLQREATLTRATPDIMEELGQKILGSLPSSRKVSRKAPSQQYKAIFELNWDPLLFIKEQEYTESPDEALERAITITGSTNDAQAVTTGEYLSQTWPATGKDVMRLVTDVVRNTKDHHVASSLPDGTELDAHIDGGKFILTAVGPGDSLAEIGQQFAWLGAALRSSPFEAGVVTCSPFVQSTRLDNILSPAEASEPRPLVEIFCVIDFNMYQLPPNDEGLPGQCWYNMFKNPVMVIGYPILTKHDRGLGLEIPLNMVAALAGSNRANEFDGKIFIKGFSTMLIATKITRDLLIWHYFYNRQGERISYLDHELQNVDSISLLQLDSARHVVGWCSKFTSYAGECSPSEL